MKSAIIIILALCVWTCSPALATMQSIEFSPGGDGAGRWSYDGKGTMHFYQDIVVDSGLGSNYDSLVGATVCIPNLAVGEGPIGSWTVKPLDNSILTIKGADGTVFLKATLGAGNLVPVGTTGVAYTGLTTDLTDVTITAAGKALGSDVLKAIAKTGTTTLDFALSLQSGSGTQYNSLAEMLSGGFKGKGGFSGTITIPEPATIALLGLGSLALLRKRKQTLG